MPISNLGALKTQAGASSLIQQTSGLYPQAESPPNSGGGPRPGGQAGRGCRVLMVGPWQVWHRPGLCPQLAAWTPAAERPAPLPPSVWSEAIQPPGRCVPPHRLGAERATPPRGRDDGWRPSPRPRTPPGPSTEEGLGAAAGRLVSMLRQPRPGSSGVLPTPPAAPFPGVSPQPRPAARPRGQLSPGPGPARPDSAVPLQPLLSLDHWVTTRFAGAGDVRVTVQAACGSSVLQDSKVVRVLGESPGGWAACQGSQPHAPVLGGPGPHRRRPHRVPRRRDRPPAGSGLIVALITTHFALRTAPPGGRGRRSGGRWDRPRPLPTHSPDERPWRGVAGRRVPDVRLTPSVTASGVGRDDSMSVNIVQLARRLTRLRNVFRVTRPVQTSPRDSRSRRAAPARPGLTPSDPLARFAPPPPATADQLLHLRARFLV